MQFGKANQIGFILKHIEGTFSERGGNPGQGGLNIP